MPALHGGPHSIADRDIESLMAERERCQELSGFEDIYADFPDYIVRCTHRIWEQKNLGLIRTHYSEDCPIHTINGDFSGVESIVTNTMATLAGFPDRTLYAEDVIWSGDAESGFFSSHRIFSHLTNLGPSEFGPPTGRAATVRTIADCEVRENRIVREWLVRDNLALVWQLGLNPHAVARAQAVLDPPQSLLRGQETHTAATGPESERLLRTLDSIWNGRLFGKTADLYSPMAAFHGPSGRELHGPSAICGNVISLLATLPDARIVFDLCTTIPAGRGGLSIAIRWRLSGTHSRAGLYGPPSAKPILIPGISHFHYDRDRIQEEWTVFDELGVLRQIYAGGGA